MTAVLEVRDVWKAYAQPVLSQFDFDLKAGEVHALVGSNGAGKSTFANILSGLVRPDAGEMLLAGKPYSPRSLPDAQTQGVVLVEQELNCLPTLSIAENLFLDCLPRRWGCVRREELHRDARAALQRVALDHLDVTAPASTLGVGQLQLVEIARALTKRCSVLILDEPTAALTDHETEGLFEHIRRLQAAGVGMIYISHRMDEIRRIADRVTVLRDGRRIATHAAAATSTRQLVAEMAGHELPPREAVAERVARTETALEVRNLVSGERVRGVSFVVRRGEILGLAGLIGSGRTETLRTIFGAEPASTGEVRVGGEGDWQRFKAPRDAVAAGLGLVPEDRKQDGLLLPQPIRVNATLARLPHDRAGRIDRHRERQITERIRERLQVRCDAIEQPIATLSGGNQQKVVIGRWLERDCRVLLFDEPTRGIDVGAKETIYALLRELAREGRGIVVASSDLPELMSLCDRIVVLSTGRVAGEFTPPSWSQAAITRAAFSGHLSS